MSVNTIIFTLQRTPAIMKHFVRTIPEEILKEHRNPEKWCIHEHVCHLAAAQPMMIERVQRFMKEERPRFVPYHPEKATPKDELMKMDLKLSLQQFTKLRAEFVRQLHLLDEADWKKQADHPEYILYTPLIMARHALIHDYVHMRCIEDLWLLRDFPE